MINKSKKVNNTKKSDAIKVIGGMLGFLVLAVYMVFIGLPQLEGGLDEMKSNTASFEKMLVVAESKDDNAEKAAFVTFTTKAVEDDYMDASERSKSFNLYMAMLSTIEPTACMHPILKNTVGDWLRKDWLNAMQRQLDDKPCIIE